MRPVLVCLAGLALVAACSKPPPPAAQSNAALAPGAMAPAAATAATVPTAPIVPTGAPVSGAFTVDGKPAALTQVMAYKDDPFDGQPIIAIVFSDKDQAGDAQAAMDSMFGNFGDAIDARVEPDGTVIGLDVVHAGLKTPGSVSIGGVLTMQDYKDVGGVISGHLTSGGPTDVFGQKVNVDLTFHTKAP